MKRPLVVMVSEMAFRLIPFLFEVMTVMRWIASNSTISLFDYLIVQELKSKLKERDASRVLFPPAKAKSRIVGVLVLAGLIALLFVPLLVMSSNETVSIVNPGSVATASFGVSGLPTFYDNQVAIAGRILAESERRQITGNDLARFWQSPLEQVQLIDLPFSSMREWTVSADALNESDTYLKQPDAVCYPYGSLQFIMAKATTSNRVQTVTLELAGDQLPRDALNNLTAAIEKNSSSIFIPALLPMFVTVGYDEAPKSISNYAYKVEFRYVNATNGNGPYWQMKSYPPQISGLPGFMTNTAGISRVLIWSEKVPNAITGTMMASTGGILGLYSFILLTIGQWIAGWVAGLFVDLWLSRMVNPQRLLNIVLALEAYELSGEYDKEFELSELLLENLRFTGRVVQMTNAPGPEP
jgi:hypothetical protein